MSGVARFVGSVAGVVAVVAAVIPGGQAIAGIAAAVSAAANVGAQLTAKKPPAATGSVNKTTIGANQPRPYLIGETYYGGSRIHHEGYGGKTGGVNNPYKLLVDVYSGAGPVEGMVAPYLDFVEVPLSGNAAQGYAANHLWLYWQLGQTPEPQALPIRWPGAAGWTAQHKLSSFAAIAWCLRFDEDGKRFASGTPSTGAVWRGVKCYDPRKDSTYPGGSGAHRWADPTDRAAFDAARATWEYTRCPGLHGLRYALGTWERNTASTLSTYRKTFGIGIPIDGIRVGDFVALANVCDANGWHVDGTIFEPGNRDVNLKNILAAGGAERAWVGGKLGLKLSAPRVALDTITEYDLATDDVEIGAMQGWEQRLNTLIPKYRSAAHKWEYVPSAAVTITSYLVEDGEEKADERQYNLVQDRNQAAQLAAYELLDARELGEIVLTCKPRLRRYGAGDMLIVHLPDDGLVQQPCVVLKRTIDPVRMTVELILRGETPEKHDFALGRTGTAPPTPSLVAGDVLDDVAADAPLDWDAVTGPRKPEDNADVTADALPSAWELLTGRPAPDVVAAQIVHTNAILAGDLRQDDLLQVFDLRTLVEGQGVAAAHLNFRNEQIGANAAFTSQFSALGVKTEDGTGWSLNLQSVRVGELSLGARFEGLDDAVGTLSTSLEELGANYAGTAASVTFLRQALVTESGSYAGAILRADADGVFGAFSITAGGIERRSRISFVADEIEFVDPNGGNAVKILTYGLDNRLYLSADVYVRNLVADTIETKHLKIGTVANLTTSSFPSVAIGAGETTILEQTGIMLGDGLYGVGVALITFAQDGTSAIDTAIIVRIYVDEGAGWTLFSVDETPMGIRVTGTGDARWGLRQTLQVPLIATGPVGIRVTAQGAQIAGGGNTTGSYARRPIMTIFSGAR